MPPNDAVSPSPYISLAIEKRISEMIPAHGVVDTPVSLLASVMSRDITEDRVRDNPGPRAPFTCQYIYKSDADALTAGVSATKS